MKPVLKSAPKPAGMLSLGSQLKAAAAQLTTLPARNRQASLRDKAGPKRHRAILTVPLYSADLTKLSALTLHLMRSGFRKNEALVMQTAIQRLQVTDELLKAPTVPSTGATRKNFSVQQPELDRLAEITKYLYAHDKPATHADAARHALRRAIADADFVALATDLQERYDHRRRK